jgi:hypothetical protein
VVDTERDGLGVLDDVIEDLVGDAATAYRVVERVLRGQTDFHAAHASTAEPD